LLTQYRLLRLGIDSALMTTDSGVDLVAYVPGYREARTIQVKTIEKPAAAGGRGKTELTWWFAPHCPAEFVAFVSLHTEQIWIFTLAEANELAQQRPAHGLKAHLYMHLEDVRTRSGHARTHVDHFDDFLIERRLPAVLMNSPPDA